MNSNWPRWIAASINQHFWARRQSLNFYSEGMNRPQDEPGDLIELRFDGPYITELSKNYFRVEMEINVLIKAMKNEKDLYKIETQIGIVLAAFTSTIGLFKFGNQVGDDESSFGCLSLKSKNKEKLIVSRFGIIEPTNRVMNASVEGHYETQLSQ